jgi:hypothetical protein
VIFYCECGKSYQIVEAGYHGETVSSQPKSAATMDGSSCVDCGTFVRVGRNGRPFSRCWDCKTKYEETLVQCGGCATGRYDPIKYTECYQCSMASRGEEYAV